MFFAGVEEVSPVRPPRQVIYLAVYGSYECGAGAFEDAAQAHRVTAYPYLQSYTWPRSA